MVIYYVIQEKNLFVLRQKRFADALKAGKEHPHDVCAYAHSLDEMKDMVAKYFTGDVDYSAVETK
jgi:hypothetical protein